MSYLSKCKTCTVVILGGAALFLFEKWCFTMAGAVLERSMGKIHFIMVEKLLP